MVVTDGVFSMDGDEARIAELSKLAAGNQAWLMIDDAHGFGTLGKTGAGLLEQEELTQQAVPILMATLGKACGTAGAFVAGSEELIEYLIQTARTFIYTTALPPSIAAASRTSLKLVATETWRREKLQELIQYFRQGAEQLSLNVLPSNTPIQPILVNTNEEAVRVSSLLEDDKILVTAIRPPTVPVGSSRLRVTFSANHTTEHIDKLLGALDNAKIKSFRP